MPEVGVSEEGDCCKIISLNDLKFKTEIFVRIDMKHLKLFVCNQFFLLLKQFVGCQKLLHVYA